MSSQRDTYIFAYSSLQALFGPKGRERLRYQLFESSSFGENDLLFKDVTDKLVILTEDEDISQVLGLDYVALLKGLGHEGAYSHWYVAVNIDTVDLMVNERTYKNSTLYPGSSLEDSVIRWCCISQAEQKKCEQWALSIKSDPLVCVRATSMGDCVEKIKVSIVYYKEAQSRHCYYI